MLNLLDEEFMDSLLLDVRFQYVLHTTSFKEQPIGDRMFSRFRRRYLTYETEVGVDLIHDCMKELSEVMAVIMNINDKMKCMDSNILQNPSDSDTTFRSKAGKNHRGYTANITESVGENDSIVTDYQYDQNTHSDSLFLKKR